MNVNVSGDNACFEHIVDNVQQMCEMAYFEKGNVFPHSKDEMRRYVRTLIVNRVRWLQKKANRKLRLDPTVSPYDKGVLYPAILNTFLSGLGYCYIDDLNVQITYFTFEGEINAESMAECSMATNIMDVDELHAFCRSLYLIKGALSAVNQTVATSDGAPDLCGFQVEFGNAHRPYMVVRSVLKSFAQPYALYAAVFGLSGIGSIHSLNFYRGSEAEIQRACSALTIDKM
jgi:hypothetical protein